MEREELKGIFAVYGLWNLVEDISDDGDGVLQLTEEGERFVRDLEEILS